MADEEVEQLPTREELDKENKILKEELEQHKKLFDLHRAVLEPYLSKTLKDFVSNLQITMKEK